MEQKSKTKQLPVSTGGVLTLKNPWSMTPSLGNLEAYINAVNQIPFLTQEEEKRYARALKEDNNIEAAGKLILSHLRLVVSISRQYLGYGLPHADLIQEGNIGLMKAVRRFDVDMGVRLVSYAHHWIKAEIHEYILRNWRMVKVATTKAQRKLFFNLRSMKQHLKNKEDHTHHQDALNDRQISDMANRLGVKKKDVAEMEIRLDGKDIGLEGSPNEEEAGFAPIAYLSDHTQEPSQLIQVEERNQLANEGVKKAIAALDPRSQRIVQQRWLEVNDDGSGGMTLHELAAEYGVSAERIRQIEVAAMKKMRRFLEQAR